MAQPYLQTLPQSLAVFPQLLAQQEPLLIKGKHTSGDYSVTTLSTGQPVLEVDSKSLSLSHRMRITDASGRHLCDLRKETWKIGAAHYYGEDPNDESRHFFDLTIRSGFSGAKTVLEFVNAITGKRECLYFHNNSLGNHGTVYWGAPEGHGGIPVADIDREMWRLRTEYHVSVAPGMDPVLIIGLLMALDDKARSEATTRGASVVAATSS